MANKPSTGNYHEDVKRNNIIKLRELEKKLPSFCSDYFRGVSNNISTRTMLGYAYDLNIFFNFLNSEIFKEKNILITAYTVELMDEIKKIHIEMYMDYLSYYILDDGTVHTNDERGKARKLAAVKGLFKYLFESEHIKNNVPQLVHSPKIHEKNIIKLDPNEVARLLDIVENGSSNESKHQKSYHNINTTRDLCLLTLLLGTGLRVSECVGLNIKDIDFDNNGLRIIRKGGNESTVYFGDEVEDALRTYLESRKSVVPLSGHEDALFLSMQKRRISVRAVENLVKKYASQVTTLKKITPHKLRSTYGSTLYQESGDIYLVADVLGHKDVNTTRKHYASMSDENRRKAARIVKLRSNS